MSTLTIIALIVGAMGLGALAAALYAGIRAQRQAREGERIARALSRYDYRTDSWHPDFWHPDQRRGHKP